MIRAFLSVFRPSYPRIIVYMLQSTEYQIGPYLRWFWRTQDFSRVMQRRALELTRPARLLLLAVRLGIVLEILAGIGLIIWHPVGGIAFGLALLLGYPVVWGHFVAVPLELGRILITQPAEHKLIEQSRGIFADHPGIKIAVAGSYGKTSMKELLATVLSHGLKVAATPANKNVSISHAYFARKLQGDEDVLIIEYGEGKPGDVARFAAITKPTHGVITGLAPAHLDQYGTLQAAGEDIFSLGRAVEALYVNSDSPDVTPFLHPEYARFSNAGALGWKVSAVKTSVQGTSFTLSKGSKKIALHSGLVGKHQVGFLAFVAAFGLELGMTQAQVKAGIAETRPFEHRMQPYELGGAWVIDDTYNGNLEGIRAGTALLAELPAKRKIYVTPGLVDQGAESHRVHVEVGELIAAACPDIVVLMNNSATDAIVEGLNRKSFKGELRIESEPLEFYRNLKHLVAHGDLVVMQNDWTDNYA